MRLPVIGLDNDRRDASLAALGIASVLIVKFNAVTRRRFVLSA
jgi:hypothetical protein